MTADIRTAAAQRECVNCGKAYIPTSDTQKFCESMCKRENYMKRRYGEEYAAEWRRYKELRAARFTPKPARVTPTREQIEDVLRKSGAWCGDCNFEMDHCSGCKHVREVYAESVLRLIQELAEGEMIET
jgi:hypothetical protein